MNKYLNSPFLKFILGLIELLLVIAFVLKALHAGVNAPFVKGLYAVTDSFAAPFKGMFTDKSLSSGGYWDMATFSGIIIYAIFVVIPIFLHQKYQKEQKNKPQPEQPTVTQ